MKYSVKFFPEKRKGETKNIPIRLRVAYASQRMEFYTGKRCNIDSDSKKSQWDPENGRLKKNQVAPNGQSSTLFNADLNKLNVAVDELFKGYDASKVVPSPEQVRSDLKKAIGKVEKTESEKVGFFERFDQYLTDAPLSAGRKKHVKTTYNKLKAFDPAISYEKLDVDFLTRFQNYLLGDCNLSKNTAISELRRLRAFLGYSINHGWTTNYPFTSFTIDHESFGDPVFITVEERDKLFNAVIENQTLARVRDIFVFQCLVGCRVGDLLKLKKSNVIDGFVEYIASKTKDEKVRVARVPLTEKAKTILAKYDLPGDQILPFISEQKYNEYIKKVFKLDDIKIVRMVTVHDPKTRVSVQKSIADLATSHMARRVFIGSLHRKGVKNEIIASMSGHTNDSKAFARYYNIDKDDQKEAMKAIE